MPGQPCRLSTLNQALATAVAALTLLTTGCGQGHSLPHPADAAAARAQPAPRLPLRVAADLVVKRVQFGIFRPDASGEDEFVPATEVPAEDGQAFGWVVEVETSRESLHWQEHLRLPKEPADWGDAASDPDITIAADGRTAVAQGDDVIDDDGTLTRSYWSLAIGDPAGDYEMDVAVEGRAVGHFAFHVPTPVAEKPMLVRRVPRQTAMRLVVWHGNHRSREVHSWK